VAHPQIAAFARLAEGGAKATRKLEGQKTLLARTMHALAYDEIHDEIIAPQEFAQAILIFRGGAKGEEPPVRVIQGPLTQIAGVDQLAVDPVHGEIFIPSRDRVLVFSREANGNVAPLRVLKGPDTLLGGSAAAVDPVHDLLLVSGTLPDRSGSAEAGGTNRSGGGGGGGGISIFNRTDQGNVKPKAVIRDRSLGGGRVFVYGPRGAILAVANAPGGGAEGGRSMATDTGFVGVWSISDNGNVPPRWMIGGPKGELLQIRGVTMDPQHKTVMISDKRLNSVFTYSFPEIF
jgi:hypothetical protein